MKFEILNYQNQVMAVCEQMKHVPEPQTMGSMNEGGYKFRLDGKIISLKQAKQFKRTGSIEKSKKLNYS